MFIINRLEEVAQIVKNEPDHDERPKVMREELGKIVFPKSFQLPLDPYKTCRGIQIDKCRVMDSKKLPLWLTFIREDPWEPPLVVLFKSGDDLRQDQLTLQILRVMDRLWKDEGQDMNMCPYRCCATGFEQGMLEVVGDSATLAGITMNNVPGPKGFRKKIAVTRETMKGRNALGLWLEKHNRGKQGNGEAAERKDQAESSGVPEVLFPSQRGDASVSESKSEFTVHAKEPKTMHHRKGPDGEQFEFVNPLQQGGKMVKALDHFETSCAGYVRHFERARARADPTSAQRKEC